MSARAAVAYCACVAMLSCSTIGRSFKSDPERLSRLVVGQTTPQEAVGILDGEPYIRQNLADGSIVWHWQRIAAGAYVGVTDNRYLVLKFTSPDGGKTWRFKTVVHAQNIDLPPGMPFGAVVK